MGAEDNVVIYCVYGRRVSQGICATLREKCVRVSYLEGGMVGWKMLIRSGTAKAGK